MTEKKDPEILIVPLGGLGEIGMNCMAIESTDEIIVVDCGNLFPGLEGFGVDFAMPNLQYLLDRKEKLKAFLLTHAHEDHMGSIGIAFKFGLNAPIYASPFTRKMAETKLLERGLLEEVKFKEFSPGDFFQVGQFGVQTVPVNHSIVEAVSMFIDTPVGRILHTGDFRVDDKPVYGKKISFSQFKKESKKGIRLMMSDSTNVEKTTFNKSESSLFEPLQKRIKKTKGYVVVSLFSSNIARVCQLLRIAKKLKRKVLLSGRSLEQNFRIAVETGYLKEFEGLVIDRDELTQLKRNQVMFLTTGCQGDYRSALWRIGMGDHQLIDLQKGDLVLFSSKVIPGNEKPISRLINNLLKQEAQVVYEGKDHVHVSGHASKPELKKMIETVRPYFFIPIHGEFRHLVHHAELAEETGVPKKRIRLAVNGDIIRLTKKSCEIIDHFEETKILIESKGGNDITRALLKERRQLGEKGVIFCLMVRDPEKDKIVTGPEIITRGVVNEMLSPELNEEALRVAKSAIQQFERDLKGGQVKEELGEIVRIELRRFYNQNLGVKPTVIPMVVDV